MAKVLQYNATLTAREDCTPLLAVFRVEPDETFPEGAPAAPWFVPGQYVTIGLNREDVDAKEYGADAPVSVRRPMSVASAPEDRAGADFYIRYVNHPDSDLPLTHLLWRRQVGARMYMRPVATGRFTLEHTVGTEDRRLKVMVAAGTGLAPFVSIARSRLNRGQPVDDLVILHGASYPDDLGYRAELERLAREHGLKYVPTVSRPQEAPEWSGAKGRVEALFAPEQLAATERAMGLAEGELTPDRAAILICGLQGTIATTVESLMKRGFIPDNRKIRRVLEVPESEASSVFYEQYDTTPVIDVTDQALVDRLRAELHQALAAR